MLGRTGSSAAASGWVIRVNKPTAPGFPCQYTTLLTGIVPWAGERKVFCFSSFFFSFPALWKNKSKLTLLPFSSLDRNPQNTIKTSGLGAAPKSNLLYGIGDRAVFTVQLFQDGTAVIVSQLAFAGFTGAGDITSAPGGAVYAVSGAGKNAYQVVVDGNFYPTSVTGPIATTGSVREKVFF